MKRISTSVEAIPSTRFQPDGGALGPTALYVMREADGEFRRAVLRGGSLSHVCAPTQMGKSSLCLATKRWLETKDIRVVWVDLGSYVSADTLESWYQDLLFDLLEELRLPTELSTTIWEQHVSQPDAVRWRLILRDLVQRHLSSSAAVRAGEETRLVFLFDEVDSILSCYYSLDSFLGVLHACVEESRKLSESVFRNVSFCLVGRRAPHQLFRQNTILQVGERIDLRDFSRREIAEFGEELRRHNVLPEPIIEQIYKYTQGHPFMTNKLCDLVVAKHAETKEDVDALVHKHFPKEGYLSIPAFKAVEDRVREHPRRADLLELYRKVLLDHGRRIPEGRSDELQNELVLSGLCCWRNRRLSPRNRLFEDVFDKEWLRQTRGAPRLIDEKIDDWLAHERDPQCLLRGAELRRAQDWAGERADLTALEREFLAASHWHRRQQQFVTSYSLIIAFSVLVICLIVLIWRNRELEQTRSNLTKLIVAKEEHTKTLLVQVDGLSLLVQKLTSDREQLAADNKKISGEKLQLQQRYDFLDQQLRAVGMERQRLQDEVEKVRADLDRSNVKNQGLLYQYERLRQVLKETTEKSEKATAELWAAREQIERLTQQASENGGNREIRITAPKHIYRHNAPVRSVVISGDNHWIYTGDQNGQLSAWKTGQAQVEFPLRRHSSAINDLALNPRGGQLASVDSLGLGLVWDLAKREVVAELRGHVGGIDCVAFSPNGQLVATGGQDGSTQIWDAKSGRQLRVLRGHKKEASALAFSSDGHLLVTGGADQILRVYSWTSDDLGDVRELLRIKTKLSSKPSFLTLTPNQRGILLGSTKGQTGLWFLSGNKAVAANILGSQPAGSFVAAMYSRDRSYFATIDVQGEVLVWEAFTGQVLRRISVGAIEEGRKLSPSEMAKVAYDAAFSQDGKWLVTASDDNAARMYALGLD